jgi:hypothetical protein
MTSKLKRLLKRRRAVKLAAEDVQLQRRRFRLSAWDQVFHPSIDFKIDEAMVANLCAYLDARAERGGGMPAVLKQHQEDGISYGQVLGLAAEEDGPWVDVGLIPEAAQLWDEGKLAYWSPHFEWDFEDPHIADEADPTKPHVWPVRLRELSFVSVGHLLNNPPVGSRLASHPKGSVLLAAPAPVKERKMPFTPEDIKMLTDALVPAVAAAVMDKMKAEMEMESEAEDTALEGEEADVSAEMEGEMDPENKAQAALTSTVNTLKTSVTKLDAENKTMKAQLAAETKRRVEGEVQADLAGVQLSAAQVSSLVSLKMGSDQEMYKTVLGGLRTAALAGGTYERGTAGEPISAKSSATLSASVLEAKKAGVKLGAPILKHLRAEGYDIDKLTEQDHKTIRKAYGA